MNNKYLEGKRITLISKKLVLFMALLIILIIFIIVFSSTLNNNSRTSSNAVKDNAQIIHKPTVKPIGISSNLMIVGDIFWSRRMHNAAQTSSLKEKYPFSELDTFKRNSYDTWIGNMECPTNPNIQPTSYQEQTLLQFNCPASYLPELAKWFDVVSLANNHTGNHGLESFNVTRQQLDKNKIQYFGHYDPLIKNELCEIIGLPAKMIMTDKTTKDIKIPIAMCGYHGVLRIPPDESLAVIKEYSQYMPVIAMPHMGVEYQSQADTLRKNVYRKMIDYGADAVFGNHPHWVQNTEAYKGKLIVYSMGNFIFDQQFSDEVTRSAVFSTKYSTNTGIDSNLLEEWATLGEKCTLFADNCLEQIKDKKLSKLPFSLTYTVAASDSSNNIVTKLADQNLTNKVIERLDWNNTMNKLVSDNQ